MSQQERCAIKIENLYVVLRGGIAPPNRRFIIKEILDTEKCQKWHDLRMIREATAEQLLKAMPQSSLEEARRNDEVCAEITAEYTTWYLKAVYRALPLRARAYYYFQDYDRQITFATSIMLGGAFGFIARSPVIGALVAGATEAFSKAFRK
jgi:hypothetical protein